MNRRFTRGLGTSLAVLLAASVALSGCGRRDAAPGGDGDAEAPVAGGVFMDTAIGDAKNLNPILYADAASGQPVGYMFDGLVGYNDKIEPFGRLASRWVVSPDGLTWTFHLRENVRWHDGAPFTGKDVAFTVWAILHPEYTGVRASSFMLLKGGPEYAANLAALRQRLKDKAISEADFKAESLRLWQELKQAGGITLNGDHEVTFTLDRPFAPFMTTMSTGILPEHLLRGTEGQPMAQHEFNKRPVGTGMFKFGEWVKDGHIKLVRNDDYYLGAPNFEQIVIRVIPDSQNTMIALETGAADRSGIQPEMFEHFSKMNHVRVHEWMSFNYTYLGYNLKKPMFQDPRVRKAITHAINRQGIVDKILLGHGALANTHSSPARWDYNPDIPVLEHNLDKARALLQEAGWTPGPDGILLKDGQRFSFSIATNNGNKLREQATVIIQQDLKRIGMDVKTELQEWNAFLDNIDAGKTDAYVVGWSLGYDPDPYEIFHSRGGFNKMHGYQNPRVDELIEKGRTTVDQAERKQIYRELQRILAEDQVYTWLFFGNTIVGLSQRVKGPITGTPAGMDWKLDKWFIPKQFQAVRQ